MVEGPLVHRVAEIHRLLFFAKAFAATSPSGRFAEGASAIDGRYVSLIEAHGKNIFYFFTREKLEKAVLAKLPQDVVVVHIHFGMSGSFRTFAFPGPEPREKTRLRLESKKEKLEAHLSASVCLHGDMEMYKKTIARLGPDPLRIDADKETMWIKMQKSRKKIGSMLMDQSLIAGIGNIYRAEILFVTGVHPDQRASTLSRSIFEKLWSHSVRLFRLGLVTGSIITLSQEDAGKPYSELKSGERCYVYGHSVCKICGGTVRTWPSAGRTVYACEVCQPLRDNNDKDVVKRLGEDNFLAQSEAVEPQSGLISNEDDPGEPVDTNPEKRKSLVKNTTEVSSTPELRKRMVVDDKIIEHQPLKDYFSGRLVDFSSSVADLTEPRLNLRVLGKGPLKHSPGWPTKYHSDASQYGRVIHKGTSWCSCPTFTNHCFPTQRVGCFTMQILGTISPRATVGLRALRTLCLGPTLPRFMWSPKLSSAPQLLHV